MIQRLLFYKLSSVIQHSLTFPTAIPSFKFMHNFQNWLLDLFIYLTLYLFTGFSVHLPTFQCVVNGFSNQSSLIKFRKERNLPRLPKLGAPFRPKSGVWREDGLFCSPFAGSDRSVIARSQRYLHEKEQKVPVSRLYIINVNSDTNRQ